MNCRFCGTELKHVFVDLGEAPPSNAYLSASQLDKPESFFPLKIFVCSNCFLVQVDEYKKASEIFDNEYAYFSSYSTSWLAHAKAYTEKMITRFGFNKNSLVIEIASNDGYLLQYFKERGIPVLGIEPTESTAKVAREKGIESITEFFGEKFAEKLVAENRKADLLLGNNVLAHVPDINDFVEGLKVALKADGVITMEFPHLVKLIENNQFDTIYHEHFSYLSFTTVTRIFKAHGLDMFDVEEIPTHGGSLRIYAKHQEDVSKSISKNVNELLEKENRKGISDLNYYKGFGEKVNGIKMDLLQFLSEQKSVGKKIAAYGAAAKGNTLLNYCGIKNDLISFVVDASPYKQGKFLPGSHIPIVKEEMIKAERPDFILILPWNIQEEIEMQLNYVAEWKGVFVTAIPKLSIRKTA
ncbi:MAG: class I SAM-dependent methyltransferase [Bacteroidetes bacterium]|nr:class I SAM-dependent methyltransferase [Bacteroidota bacterium]